MASNQLKFDNYHDCHVMCNRNLFAHLSAASLAVSSKCFTVAARCFHTSKSDCTAIRAIRAIRAKAMTHRVTGSTGFRRLLSWNSSCGVVGLTLTPLRVLPNMSTVFARFGLMPSRSVQHGTERCHRMPTYHAKWLCVVHGPCWPWSRPSRHAGITKVANCPTGNPFLKASAQIEQACIAFVRG